MDSPEGMNITMEDEVEKLTHLDKKIQQILDEENKILGGIRDDQAKADSGLKNVHIERSNSIDQISPKEDKQISIDVEDYEAILNSAQ